MAERKEIYWKNWQSEVTENIIPVNLSNTTSASTAWNHIKETYSKQQRTVAIVSCLLSPLAELCKQYHLAQHGYSLAGGGTGQLTCVPVLLWHTQASPTSKPASWQKSVKRRLTQMLHGQKISPPSGSGSPEEKSFTVFCLANVYVQTYNAIGVQIFLFSVFCTVIRKMWWKDIQS